MTNELFQQLDNVNTEIAKTLGQITKFKVEFIESGVCFTAVGFNVIMDKSKSEKFCYRISKDKKVLPEGTILCNTIHKFTTYPRLPLNKTTALVLIDDNPSLIYEITEQSRKDSAFRDYCLNFRFTSVNPVISDNLIQNFVLKHQISHKLNVLSLLKDVLFLETFLEVHEWTEKNERYF